MRGMGWVLRDYGMPWRHLRECWCHQQPEGVVILVVMVVAGAVVVVDRAASDDEHKTTGMRRTQGGLVGVAASNGLQYRS